MKRKINSMISLSLGFVLIFISSGAAAETRWLAIAATEKDLTTVTCRRHALGRGLEEKLELISSSDCQSLKKGLFLVVAEGQLKENEAREHADSWRKKGIKDAYIKKCVVSPYSRLDLGIPVLDESIYNRPKEVVNWTYEEAISQVRQVSGRLVAVIRPRYEPTPEDVMEGLRISVSVLMKPGKNLLQLETNCIDPELASDTNIVAVSCVNATAADNLLHITRFYELPSAKLLHEHDRCRKPQIKQNSLLCQEEHIDKDGILTLKPYKYEISKQ